jgi:hypothetical protein
MATTDPFVTRERLERRLGSDTFRRIFDHNSDGVADGPSYQSICDDAESKLRGAFGPTYAQAALDPAVAKDLLRIGLDAALAMIARDFPGAYPRDWVSMMQQVDRDIKAVRSTIANLGTDNPPEPAANNGGSVTNGDPDHPDYCAEQFALNGTGSF